MALTYGFYNAVNHDRTYDAIQMSSIFDGIIKDGIFQSIGTAMIPTATGTDMNVNVGIGRAWFNHTWTLNDAILPVEVPESEVVLDRIDALVLEVNAEDTVRANDIKIIKGTPSSEPVRPTLTNTLTVHQYALAYVSVKAGVTVIEQADITNMIGSEDTPFITGILETVDTEQLILQWQNQWDNWMRDTTAEESTWFATMRAEFDTWATGQRADFAEWSTEQKADFEAWEETIRDILDQGAAGHLQNEIDALAEVVEANTHLVHLKVSYDSAALTVGTNITVTNGDETYTEAVTEGSNYIIFNCHNLGTWTVTEDLYNTTSTVETTYYGNYETTAGGKIFITVTYDEMFYGALLTLSNGVKSYTKTAPALTSGVLFVVAETGTWTVSATVESRLYSSSINIPSDGNYELMLNALVFYLEDWLEAGGVTQTFSTLAEVLADEKTVRQLMNKHAAVDYLVASCETALDENVETIINNDYCAKWINLRDYALDTLYANEYIADAMDEADKYFYGEWVERDGVWQPKGNVPVMTSNNAPYGVASADIEFDNTTYGHFYAYNAFDTDVRSWTSINSHDSSIVHWVRYKFTNPVCAKKIYYIVTGDGNVPMDAAVHIEASNDGTTWTELKQFTHLSTDAEKGKYIYLENDNYYLYYRWRSGPTVHCFANINYYTTVNTLQFYGRELKASVPVMTSNTEPWGECSASKENGTEQAWKLFDGNTSTHWSPGAGNITNEWVQYDFKNPMVVKTAIFTPLFSSSLRCKNFKILASNDNFVSDTHELYVGEFTTNAAQTMYINVSNGAAYKCYRLFVVDTFNNTNITLAELQFYGLDYSEHDERHWIYDHGVEVETVETDQAGTGVASKLSDYLKIQMTSGANMAEMFTSSAIELTNYSLLRMVYGKEIAGNPFRAICQTVPEYSTFVASGRAVGIPYHDYLDISNINGNYHLMFVGACENMVVTINEWWLE